MKRKTIVRAILLLIVIFTPLLWGSMYLMACGYWTLGPLVYAFSLLLMGAFIAKEA